MDAPRETAIEGETSMNTLEFEAQIVAARPSSALSNTSFTDKVMQSLNSSEIMTRQLRRMNGTNKETFIMKLRHLPKLAIIAIAVGSLLLVSGSAYAAYQVLWPKPQAQLIEVSQSESGRTQLAFSLDQCDENRLASRYELKKNATITADQVEGVVKARCELSAIDKWAQETFSAGNDMGGRVHVIPSLATHVTEKTETEWTFKGLSKYNEVDTTLNVSKSVKYIADQQEVTAETIKSGEPIIYYTKMSSTSMTPELLAVVKLSYPIENYDQFAWQSLTERVTCIGNPEDTCLTGFSAAVDLYSNANVDIGKDGANLKQIEGVITGIDGARIVIKSSSGRTFTINAPTDIVGTYNQQKAAQYYDNQRVALGNSVRIEYAEVSTEHNTTIQPSQLRSTQFLLEKVGKSDPTQAY
jgi:hypothetical protein